MPYIRIPSLVIVFFVLFAKTSTCVNDSVTAIEERGIEVDAHRSYGTVPPDMWACRSSTRLSATGAALLESEENAKPSFAVKISAPLKLAKQASSPQREGSTTPPTFYFSSGKPTTAVNPSISSPGKRGVAYNDASLVSVFSKYPKVTWAYNWADMTPDIPSSIEYVPMLWGLGHIQNWESNAEKAILSGATHLLAFNEPDIDSQADLTVTAAVVGYLAHMQPFAGKAKLGSPAVTNGGGYMGLGWLKKILEPLKDFLLRCSSCTVDFVAIHWYNGGNAGAFKDYVVQTHRRRWL